MSNLTAKAEQFSALHVPGRPLVLFNAWDAGSAKAVAAGGAAAIATGSWGVAAANGYADGEQMPVELALANLERIVGAVNLPVTIDLESGYGSNADAVARMAMRAVQAGAIGCNLEDSYPGNGTLRPAAEQVHRIGAVRAMCAGMELPFFINARTDLFLRSDPATHGALADEAIARARAYADAGASGFFVPGLADPELIARVVREAPLPLNIMVTGATPSLKQLAELGVARVSHGPRPYLQMMKALEQAARAALAG